MASHPKRRTCALSPRPSTSPWKKLFPIDKSEKLEWKGNLLLTKKVEKGLILGVADIDKKTCGVGTRKPPMAKKHILPLCWYSVGGAVGIFDDGRYRIFCEQAKDNSARKREKQKGMANFGDK